ncbi:diacylglycerol kinase family protein [Sphingomonas sp. BT-65]|uniref:diacylglycerol/lipid kinase family protein n=1 Tax=Sphingomonas sp. BT-65 TaxID=2989821 RepID=UPI0022363EA3|nr:diacylglycerol kinase family protein [Sphingomonas sp. BT-65]MCW4463337.1 diacylglycerol kinase family protein [Sphingomonas sp. BT-65]
MERLWFITNPQSGSATREKCAALEAVFEERGLVLAGRTGFPDEPIPSEDELVAARIDTVVLFAGDGTINAALCALADWDGAFLILPGGTMNLLARALHGDAEPPDIIHAAHDGGRKVALPYVEAGPHRAFVGLILGPAAHWARAREAARKGRVARVLGAMRTAWRRTFGKGIRVAGVPGMRERYQAVFVAPGANGLEVAAIDARDWASIAELGWNWLTGDWVAARAVTDRRAERLRVLRRRPVLALFDGEPVTLAPNTEVTGGMTRPAFIATLQDAA